MTFCKGAVEIPWVMKFTGDKVMVDKVKSLLFDTKKPIRVSVPEPVIDCSGTGPSGIDVSSSLGQPEQPKCAEFVVASNDDTLSDTQVEAKILENERIHENINDPITSKMALE